MVDSDSGETQNSLMRFSVGDLGWTITFAGASLFFVTQLPYYNIGYQLLAWGTIMLTASIVLSLRVRTLQYGILLFVSFVVALKAANWFLVTWLFCGLFASEIDLRTRPANSKTIHFLSGWMLAAILLGNVLVSISPPRQYAVLLEQRRAYPIRDLSHRLKSHEESRTTLDSQEPFWGSTNVPLRMTFDIDPQLWSRNQKLQEIHSRHNDHFLRKMNFGAEFIGGERLELAPLVEIPFNPSLEKQLELLSRRYPAQIHNPNKTDILSFEDLLAQNYIDFLNPEAYGWVASEKKSAGFEPHAFRHAVNKVNIENKAYSINRLELISISSQIEPKVFLLGHLPRMDQIAAPGTQ